MSSAATKPRVLLVRPVSATGDNEKDAAAISALGMTPVIDPFLEVHTSDDNSAALKVLLELPNAQWLVFTSARAVASWAELAGTHNIAAQLANAGSLRVGFVGQNTAATFELLFDSIVPKDRQLSGQLSPGGQTSEALAQKIIDATAASNEQPGLVLFPQSNIALSVLPDALASAGFKLENAVVYQTVPLAKPDTARALEAAEFDAVLLRSPSAVQAVSSQTNKINAKIVTTAGATLAAAQAANLPVAAVAKGPSADDVALALSIAINQ